MKFHKLNTLRQSKPELCVLRSFPEGMGLKTWKLGRGEELKPDEYPEELKIFMSDQEPGIEIPDLVGNTTNMLIVSRRLKDAMAAVNQGPVQYLPVGIYNHRKRLASADHFIVNPLGTVDVLDTQRSDIEYLDGKVVEVKKFVLDRTKAESAPDVFRVKEEPLAYVVSDRVFSEWRKLAPKPTNIAFLTLEEAPS